MSAIKLQAFAGMVPSVDKHLLADQNAAYCSNAWLYSGALNGMPLRVKLHDMANTNAQVAFRIATVGVDPSYLYDSFWVEFVDVDTDFIKAPVAGDSFDRYYWCSPSESPKYNTAARIVAGQPAFLLGLPQPVTPSVAVAGGVSTTLVSRAYVTTLVTAYGEEGPASAPFLVNSAKLDATFTVTIGAVLASDMGTNRNVTKIRLYRTVVGSDGSVDYYLITEVTALSTSQTFVDTALDTTIASNNPLASTAWTAPPDLDGMIAMPNGILAGFKGKELWFSDAYRPHAWPASYALYLEHDIVGLGTIGQTLVICTKGNPQTAAGVNPSSITTSKLALFEPCLTKGSIVSTEEGVYYASANGLILVNPGVADNITKQYISRDNWTSILNAGHLNGGRLGSAYYAFGSQTQGLFQDTADQNGFTQETVDLGSTQGFMLDPENSNVGFTFVGSTKNIVSVSNDPLSGELLLVMDGAVYWLDQSPGHDIEIFKWQSKVFQAPQAQNFAAFKFYGYDDPTFVYPEAQNYDINQQFNPAKQRGVVRVYADGRLIATHELRKSGELHRLPTGFKAQFWQIEFEGKFVVKNFQMATSVKELSSV